MTLIVETTRLRIETLTSDDTALVYELTSDAEVMKYFPSVLTYEQTNEMMQVILDHYQRYGYCFWKVVGKIDNEFIGIAGLLHQEIDGQAEIEIAYRVLRKQWNKGYATEAANACAEYARSTLGKTRMISLIDPDNVPSQRVAQKLGANKENAITFEGFPHDVYVY